MGTIIVQGLLAALKSVLLAVASEALIKWVIIELAVMAAKCTATTFDDELVQKIKAALDQPNQPEVK